MKEKNWTRMKEQKIIEYFKQAWKKNTGREYDGISYPFARQDTWTGKVVMDFAKFILTKEEEKVKQKIEQLLKEIEQEKKEAGKRLKKAKKDWDSGYEHGFIRALNISKQKIKTFEGVIR